ncbi:unnamed protein product [Litomosoides sigmodontis]|uniref:Protein kinase domain-containing protein n=1 Tax=Litomosoides sigmodontis TaxID=42156 RepID=A0A3P6UQ23_LITSI|nr:unnamed protein product [Litomosoides sigmodontis]
MSLSSSSCSIPKPSFQTGEIINNSWKVIGELGSGGCGIVYEVEQVNGVNVGTRAAMKAETVDANGNYSETLAAEALVLRRMQWSQHFCRLYLAGRSSPDCNIIVMSLVGRPLSWLRRQNPSQRFTLSTALRLGIQCLEAIKDLHSIGIIHRDVKGSNFAIGRGNLRRVVHMIDFGFARFYLRSEEHLLKNCPHEFYAIFDHIRHLDYSGRPNYALITRKLNEICERKHYLPEDPYDWEKNGRDSTQITSANTLTSKTDESSVSSELIEPGKLDNILQHCPFEEGKSLLMDEDEWNMENLNKSMVINETTPEHL